MSGVVGFVGANQFVTTPVEIVDPMGPATWRGLQPDGDGARAIRAAIDRVGDEQTKAEGRVDRIREERQRALLHGTEMSLSNVDIRLARASGWLERVTALAAALRTELASAENREAIAAREVARRQAAARVKIARFGHWATTEYGKHARAIAAGLELEAEAIAAAREAGLLAELPRAHTTAAEHPRGMPPTSFARLVRLPSPAPGLPIVWPAGEGYPE